jgi:hypothetical protein
MGDPLAEVRFVNLQRTWSFQERSQPKANLRTADTPLNRNRQANSRTVLHCASEDASVRRDAP